MKARRRSGRGATRRGAAEERQVDRALDAMSAPELRAAIRVVLDQLDEGVKDSVMDALLARGAKTTSGWKPAACHHESSRRRNRSRTPRVRSARRIRTM